MKWVELFLEVNVFKWVVIVLNLDRMRRYFDRVIFNMFWEVLDKYVFIGRLCFLFIVVLMFYLYIFLKFLYIVDW